MCDDMTYSRQETFLAMAFLSATYYVSYLIFKIAHDILISISKYIILRRNLMKNFDKFGVMLDCSRNAVPKCT